MNNLSETFKTMIMNALTNNPQQIVGYGVDMLSNTPWGNMMMKNLNISPNSLKQLGVAIVNTIKDGYKNKESYVSFTQTEKLQNFKDNYKTLIQSKIFDNDDDNVILAAGRSGFNTIEIKQMFNLNESLDEIYNKYAKLNNIAIEKFKQNGIGVDENQIEQNVTVDLKSVADEIKKEIS